MRTSLAEGVGCKFLRVHITCQTVEFVLLDAHWLELHAR